jgi:4-hydroxy-tetrahydrodipicolinate reductase
VDVGYLGAGESIVLAHRAAGRAIYTAGLLRMARWLVGRPPGLYRMADALGLG